MNFYVGNVHQVEFIVSETLQTDYNRKVKAKSGR